MKKFVAIVLIAIPVFVFLQSLPFKFSGADETVYIFDTIGAWITSLGLSGLGAGFAAYGAYGVGIAELIASALLLIPATRHWGALFGLGILSGAIFFHLFTPLGVAVEFPGAKPGGDPLLFIMAVIAWSCLLALVIRHRHRYPLIGDSAEAAVADAR
ncbi:MAG: hypothetical protein AAF290_11675 [Pseudomonadota bacterium]